MEAKREFMCKERIVDIEFKISRLGVLGKAYYELAQIKLKRHRTQISIARTQNLLLHAALNTLREKDRIARKNAGDLENLRKRTTTLRVTFDHQRQLVFKRHRKGGESETTPPSLKMLRIIEIMEQLEWQITGTHSAELECAGVLDPNTPLEVTIRLLEHKLVWMQMKMRDMQILVRHYEETVQPLRDDWVTYDAKLAALQGHVNMKNQECELLINTHHDAIRARDAAKNELEELLAYIFGYGKKERISPELRLKILKAIKEIKSVMDVGSMREMFHQFIVQEKQSTFLESIIGQLRTTLDLMRDDYRRTKKKSSMMDKQDVARMVDGTKTIVRRKSEYKGSFPLLQILEGTQKLVDQLHEGQITVSTPGSIESRILDKVKDSLVQILQALHRQLKKINKAAKKAEFEALEAEHWKREEAEIARRNKAAEDARKKYEEREAAREAERQKVESEALRQKVAEKEAQSQLVDETKEVPRDTKQASQSRETSNLAVGTSPQTGSRIASSGIEYLLSSYYQQAKDIEAAPTVIFLPNFQQGPLESKELATVGSAPEALVTTTLAAHSDQSEAGLESPAEPYISVVLSDDESGGTSSLDSPDSFVRVALSTEGVAGELLAAPSHPLNTATILSQSEPDQPTIVVFSIDEGVEQRPPASTKGRPREEPDPIPKIKVSVRSKGPVSVDPIGASLSIEKLSPSGSEPTSPQEAGPAKAVSLLPTDAGTPTKGPGAESASPLVAQAASPAVTVSIEASPRVLLKDGTSLASAVIRPLAAESSSIRTGTAHPIDGSSTTKPTELSQMSASELSAPTKVAAGGSGSDTAVEVALLSNERRQEEGIDTQEKPEKASSIASATVERLSPDESKSSVTKAEESTLLTSIAVDNEKAARQKGPDVRGEGLTLSSETAQRSGDGGSTVATSSTDLSPEASSKGVRGLLSPTAIAMDEGKSIVAEIPSAATVSTSPVPRIDLVSVLSPEESPIHTVDIEKVRVSESDDPSKNTPPDVTLMIPAALPSAVPAGGAKSHSEKIETHAQLLSQIPAPVTSPGESTEAADTAGVLLRGKGISGDESVVQTLQTAAESRLPRSPSGAPIASGAALPPIETVSVDESLPHKSGGGLRSPNLPRSPSGAPVATAAKFPLEPLSPPRDENVTQRPANLPGASSLPESSDTVGTLAHTRLPSTSTREQLARGASSPAVVGVTSPEQPDVTGGSSAPQK